MRLDQPWHPPSLSRVFAVRIRKAGVLSYPVSAQRRLRSAWAYAQADLSLRWAHMLFCWYCHVLAQISYKTMTTDASGADVDQFAHSCSLEHVIVYASAVITLSFLDKFSCHQSPLLDRQLLKYWFYGRTAQTMIRLCRCVRRSHMS